MPNVIGEESVQFSNFEDLLKDPDHPKIIDYVKLTVEVLQSMCLFTDYMQKYFWKPSIGQEVIKVFPIWMAEAFDDVNELCTKGLQAFILQMIRHCNNDDLPEYWKNFVASTVIQSAQDGKFEYARTMAKTLAKLWRSNNLNRLLFYCQLFEIIEMLSVYPDQETQQLAIPLKTEVSRWIELRRLLFEAFGIGPGGANQRQRAE